MPPLRLVSLGQTIPAGDPFEFTLHNRTKWAWGETYGIAPPNISVAFADATGITARYIRIWWNGTAPKILNLGEVRPFGPHGDIQPVSAAQSSANGPTCGAGSCIDNRPMLLNHTGGHCFGDNSLCHTLGDDGQPWLEIDLGSPQPVSSVQVLNRRDCCQSRIIGFSIGLFWTAGGVDPVGLPQRFEAAQDAYDFSFAPPVSETASAAAIWIGPFRSLIYTVSIHATALCCDAGGAALAHTHCVPNRRALHAPFDRIGAPPHASCRRAQMSASFGRPLWTL